MRSKAAKKKPSSFLFFVQMKLLSEGDNSIFLLPIKFLSYPFSIRKKTKFHVFFKGFLVVVFHSAW